MVNSIELTVSKLSRLQKSIIKKLNSEGGNSALGTLAYKVAWEYEPHLTEETIKRQKFWEQKFADHGMSFLCSDLGACLVPGERGAILSNKFKASFYRSIKRLLHRGIITKYWAYYHDDIAARDVHYKCVKFTDKASEWLKKKRFWE